MNWSDYLYLLFVALAALILCLYLVPRMHKLVTHSSRATGLEIASLTLVILLGCVAIYGRYLVGSRMFAYADVGSDSLEQYVPFYLSLIRSVQAHDFSGWNYVYGLGTSIMSYQSWLLDPFNLLLLPLCLVMGEQYLGFALVIGQIAKMFLSGFAFRAILQRMCKTPFARVFGASVYAFGGYLLLWGQHYWLGSAYVTYTLLLLALERLMEQWDGRRFFAVAFVVFAIVAWSPYIGYISLLCGAVHAFMRCVQVSKKPIKLFGRLVVPTVIGIVLGGLTLLPYAHYLLAETTRTQSAPLTSRLSLFAAGHIPKSWLPAILSRFLGNSLISSGDPIPPEVMVPASQIPIVNVYEIVSLGYSVGVCVLVVQFIYWVFTKGTTKDRVTTVIAILLIALYCVNYLFPSALNLFVEPKYRSSFALAVPICTAMALAWENVVQENKVHVPLALVSLLATLAVIMWSLFNTVNGRLVCVSFLACAVALGALLLLQRKGGQATSACLLGMCAVIIASQVADGFFTTNNRIASLPQDFPGAVQPGKDANTVEALASLDLGNQSYVRVEKTYTDWTPFNDGLAQDYPGMTTYNSTYDGDVADFFRVLWPEVILWDPTYLRYNNAGNRMVLDQALGIRYVLEKDFPLEEAGYTLVRQVGDVRVYENPAVSSILSAKTQVMAESALEGMADLQARQNELLSHVVVPDEVAQGLGNQMTDGSDPLTLTDDIRDVGGSRLAGSFEASKAGVACLALPHTATWHILIDGKEVPTFRANYAFYGFEVPAGAHSIEAYYTIALAKEGLLMSCAGVCLLVAGIVLGRRMVAKQAAKGK